jgi:tetratricopeptide (TPR) repeat protein
MGRTARITMVGLLALALFAVASSGALRSLGSRPAVSADDRVRAASVRTSDLLAPTVGAGSGLEVTIAGLQQHLSDSPDDADSFASLGLAYVQQARIISDPSFYPKAKGVLRRSLALQPRDNEGALVGLAALAAARHDFAAALRLGRRARQVDPYDANVYGVIGDAQLELGRYDQAFDTFQTMVDTKPTLSAYARVSYARELLGDVAGAIRSMDVARDVAGSAADLAWTSFHLGELRFNMGDVAGAAREYRAGMQADPGFVPNLAGLGKVAWAATGDLDTAIDRFVEVTQRYPSPDYVATLGDLYLARGDRAEAQRQYDLVRAEAELFRANGVNVDLELALFDADHGDPRSALRAARSEWGRRHSVHVADALAWALHANGLDVEAATYARRASALGTRNALFSFHAGMIQRALGNTDQARSLLRRALAINPNFSVQHSPTAVATLATIEDTAKDRAKAAA